MRPRQRKLTSNQKKAVDRYIKKETRRNGEKVESVKIKIVKGGIRMSATTIYATPTLTGEDAKAIIKDAMRVPTKKMKEKHKMMLEILERVTK